MGARSCDSGTPYSGAWASYPLAAPTPALQASEFSIDLAHDQYNIASSQSQEFSGKKMQPRGIRGRVGTHLGVSIGGRAPCRHQGQKAYVGMWNAIPISVHRLPRTHSPSTIPRKKGSACR